MGTAPRQAGSKEKVQVIQSGFGDGLTTGKWSRVMGDRQASDG
jgi:hypothetical protein